MKEHWNYRILRQTYGQDNDNQEIYYYGMVEAHYIDGIVHSASEPIKINFFDELDHIKWALDKMQEAYNKPMLEYNKDGKLVEVMNEDKPTTPSSN